jgi:cytochrome c peroxidase
VTRPPLAELTQRRFAAVALILLTGCPRTGDQQTGRSESGSAQPIVTTTPDDAAPTGPPDLSEPPPLPAVPQSLPALPALPRVTPAAVAFGELLFADPRLSASGARACASCHDPVRGYSGGIDIAANGKPNARRTPALVNLAWVPNLGWDGRVASMTQLLHAHIAGQLDTVDAAATRIAAVPTYAAHIARVGGPGDAPGDVLIQALEAYVLTRYEGDSPWDSLERTERMTALGTPPNPIVAGYQLFIGKAQCAQCHTPPLYTDNQYHRVIKDAVGDTGRGLVDPRQAGAFRTPTLRGAMPRGSYFHDGSQTTLDGVIRYYQSDAARVVNRRRGTPARHVRQHADSESPGPAKACVALTGIR